jgi:hypothetical protein
MLITCVTMVAVVRRNSAKHRCQTLLSRCLHVLLRCCYCCAGFATLLFDLLSGEQADGCNLALCFLGCTLADLAVQSEAHDRMHTRWPDNACIASVYIGWHSALQLC